MSDIKRSKLDAVLAAATDFREMQHQTAVAREYFIDTILEAKDAKATQQEIAERCVIDPLKPTQHLSRQRVAQFIDERKRATGVSVESD